MPEAKETITVCAECKCASCWQGLFMCQAAGSVGTVEKTREELEALDYEHPRFWEGEHTS